MSDLDIRSGGVVAVDVASLRAAAGDLATVAARCHELADRLWSVTPILAQAGHWHLAPAERTRAAATDVERIVRDLHDMADLYELVERAATGRVSDLLGQLMLARAGADRLIERDAGFTPHRALASLLLGGLGLAATSGLLGLVQPVDRGRLSADTSLAAREGAVRTTLLSQGTASAPGTLEELTARVPHDSEARVRVERYDMTDGSTQFVAYVDGTQVGADDAEPFDMTSNLDLYLRHESADSYEALRQALQSAGAETGATVHLVGYSQGAMAVSHVALSGEYRVPTLVTVGSPVEADVGDETLSVSLRHTDDPVAYLATGGFAAGVGAVGSFVAERRIGAANVIEPHQMKNYRETAALLDASPDPRMDAVRERLAGLGAAASVTVSAYGAQRAPQPGGGRGGGGV